MKGFYLKEGWEKCYDDIQNQAKNKNRKVNKIYNINDKRLNTREDIFHEARIIILE